MCIEENGWADYKKNDMTETILKAEKLGKTYDIGSRTIQVLNHVSLEIIRGEFVVVKGTSGSGKTTLLSLLSGLDSPSHGKIYLDGEDITHHSEDQLATIRNSCIGFVFQAFHLIPSLNALENVMFPAELQGDSDARDRAETLLKRVGLQTRHHNFPEQLSGGEKQRVALCRALINAPKIVFADEPTGNLDSQNSSEIIELFSELHRESGTTLVLATHSMELARKAERVMYLHDGILVDE